MKNKTVDERLKNYKCDGQLSFNVVGVNLEIKEQQNKRKNTKRIKNNINKNIFI